MGELTNELKIELENLIKYLQDQNETHWVEWMITAKRHLDNSDFYGIEKILSAYGGAGSIQDIADSEGIIHRVGTLANKIKKLQ